MEKAILDKSLKIARNYLKHINKIDFKNDINFDESIYSGHSGGALFLLGCYKVTEKEKYFQKANILYLNILKYCKLNDSKFYSIYCGRLSIIVLALDFYDVTKDKKYLEDALFFVKGIERFIEHEIFDFLNGISGSIIPLLDLYLKTGCKDTFGVLEILTNNLIKGIKIGENGIYWDLNSKMIQPLCGMSHGSSGIGFVFLQLGKVFNNPTFLKIAEQSFLYENQFFSIKYSNWKDLRSKLYYYNFKDIIYKDFDLSIFQTEENYMNAWCHGAAGIGGTRLFGFILLNKKWMYEDLLISKRKITFDLEIINKNSSLSLCHGISGNVELFLLCYEFFGSKKDLDFAKNISFYLSKLDLNKDKKDYSFFTGELGIAYFMLRTLYPKKLKSVLFPNVFYNREFIKTKSETFNISEPILLKLILKNNLNLPNLDLINKFFEDRVNNNFNFVQLLTEFYQFCNNNEDLNFDEQLLIFKEYTKFKLKLSIKNISKVFLQKKVRERDHEKFFEEFGKRNEKLKIDDSSLIKEFHFGDKSLYLVFTYNGLDCFCFDLNNYTFRILEKLKFSTSITEIYNQFPQLDVKFIDKQLKELYKSNIITFKN